MGMGGGKYGLLGLKLNRSEDNFCNGETSIRPVS